MQPLNVYSSAPLSTSLAVAMLGLEGLGLEVQLLPIEALPTSSGRRPASLRFEWVQLSQRLATIGDALTAHENGALRLAAGDEQGLRAERDDLVSRKRGIEAALAELEKGGQDNG
jgi:hypothetical protein